DGELFGEAGASHPAAVREPGRSTRRRTLVIGASVVVAGLIVAAVLVVNRGTDPGDGTVVDGLAPGSNPDMPPEQPDEPQLDADDVATRLAELGQRITAYAGEHRTYPAPAAQPRLAAEQRLSWLAVLVAAAEPGGVPPDPA